MASALFAAAAAGRAVEPVYGQRRDRTASPAQFRPTLENPLAFLKVHLVLPVILFVLAGYPPAARAQAAGTFTATGNMIAARYGHTATRLSDGRVLLAGGRGSGNAILSSAEIYDPSSGAFTPTGSMTTARYWPSATLLRDGRVLIVGGTGMNGSLASVEIYDPASGTFSAAGSMSTARFLWTATLLNNGKVLVLVPGGVGYSGALYDPATQTFTATRNALVLESAQNAVLLPDGRVFFDSGTDLQGSFRAVQLYDPPTDTFSPVIGIVAPSDCCGFYDTATLLSNGNVLLAGGGNGDTGDAFASAAVYDRVRGVLMPTGRMTTRRIAHKATLLPDGQVLITGGQSECCGFGNYAGPELYDPSTGAFRSAGSMTTPRDLHTATLLNNGTVLIAGGYAGGASAELYRPQTQAAVPTINAGGIVNAASYGRGFGPAAGSIASLFGTGLATSIESATTLPLPFTLGGTSVSINGMAVPLLYVSPTQINFQIPWEICCPDDGQRVTVTVNGLSSNPSMMTAAAFGPALFSINSSGAGQGAIQIANTNILAAPIGAVPGADSRPARRGESITIYCLGLGFVTNNPGTGKPALADPPATTVNAPTVTIGGIQTTVTFSGLAPGFVGLYQVNVRVPDNAPTGDAVPVTLRIFSTPPSPPVTIAVQ